MSEILGLKTNTGNSIKNDVIGMGTQAVGIKPGDPADGGVYDENGFQIAAPAQPSWLANSVYTGLSNMPAMIPTFGFQAFRGSNTIINGGTGRANNRLQTLNPRNWNRYSSAEIFHDAVDGHNSTIMDRIMNRNGAKISDTWKKSSRGYSPFNLSDDVNKYGGKAVEKIAKRGTITREKVYDEAIEKIGGRSVRPSVVDATEEAMAEAKNKTKVFSWLEKTGAVNGEGEAQKLFGRGAVAHNMAGTRLVSMGDSVIGDRVAGNLGAAIPSASFDGAMTGRQAGLEYLSAAGSQQGVFGGRMMGHASGARYGESAIRAGSSEAYSAGAKSAAENLARGGLVNGMEGATLGDFGRGLKTAYQSAGREAAETAGKTVLKEGAEMAGKAVVKEGAEIAGKTVVKEGLMAAGKFGASFVAGLAAGPVGWVADVALTAWMIYDLAKLGTKLASEMVIKPAVNFTKEAFKSFKGDISKAPMGMGFKDNSVAMTARQRGVMAISNSRLNARSVLGSEAAGIHAHFG